MPLRPPIRVVQPRDWTQSLTTLLVVAVLAMLVVIALLVRFPAHWVAAVGGAPWVLRLGCVLVSLVIVRWMGDLLMARLPRAAFLFGNALVFPAQTGRRRVRVSDVDDVVVDVYPPPVHEAFVVVMKDGTSHVLCPTHLPGAAALYGTLARTIARRKRREARTAAKRRPAATASPHS